jgi:hypothetical protein
MPNKVQIAIPCYSNRPHLPVMSFLFCEVQRICNELKRDANISYRSKNGLIDKVRNLMVMDFLSDPDNTDLIMMDDDNHPEQGGIVKILCAPVDIVALPCRSRGEPLSWPVRWLNQPMQRDDQTTKARPAKHTICSASDRI